MLSFERLVITGMVTKINRRLCMAVCLLLAFKFSEHEPMTDFVMNAVGGGLGAWDTSTGGGGGSASTSAQIQTQMNNNNNNNNNYSYAHQRQVEEQLNPSSRKMEQLLLFIDDEWSISKKVSRNLSLGFEGTLLYTVGVLFHVGWCII